VKPAAIIFDLDGTLLDTLADIAASMNGVLAAHGHPPHETDAYRWLVGEGIDRLVLQALPAAARQTEALDGLAAEYRRLYAACWRAHSRPYPGVPGLLAELARRALPLAVFSNKAQEFTRVMTTELLPGIPFAAVIGAGAELPKKPDPTGALRIAAQLGADPRACLFVGDSAIDMETAHAAGMTGVGVLWGFRGEAELRRASADRLVAQPRDLLALLD
jgi:phosphoglycolate phosphatase